MIADWPGLKAANLHEGRDLKPTTDLRAVLKGLLKDHLRVDERRAREQGVSRQRRGEADDGLLHSRRSSPSVSGAGRAERLGEGLEVGSREVGDAPNRRCRPRSRTAVL